MVMPILKQTVPIADRVVNDNRFRLMLETHRGYFRQEGNSELHTVDKHAAFKYQFDLYGYLTSKKVNPELHWITMRINDIESPTAFDNKIDYLILPTAAAYSKLKGLYATSLGKVGKK